MKTRRVHIGEIIRQKVLERGMSKAEFAKNLNIMRQNIEKTVFQKHSLDTDLVCLISEVLDCNLFDYYIYREQKKTISEKSIKTTVIIEMGAERQEKTFIITCGDNKLKIE